MMPRRVERLRDRYCPCRLAFGLELRRANDNA